jgi:hypothetical protein
MKIISLGMGVQSTALYLMSSIEKYDKADYAIFADPQAESKETYKMLNWLLEWRKKNNGIPIIINRDHNILNDTLNGVNALGRKYLTIPAHSESKSMVMRQCTGEYKIRPVLKEIRKLYNLKKGQRLPTTELWLGISIDEASRMKENTIKALKNKFPLIELMMSRLDCINFYKKNNFPVPPKSSCVFCPYHSDKTWREKKLKNGTEWKTAVKVDNKIRNMYKDIEYLKEKVYLHRNCKPLSETYFQENQMDLFENECEGHCGL